MLLKKLVRCGNKMKYLCNKCIKSSPCILDFKTLGETEPNQCPFNTKEITGAQAEAQWIKIEDILYIIGTYNCSESCGSSVSIYGVATNDIDALILFEKMKKEVVIDRANDGSYEIWNRESNTFFTDWIG